MLTALRDSFSVSVSICLSCSSSSLIGIHGLSYQVAPMLTVPTRYAFHFHQPSRVIIFGRENYPLPQTKSMRGNVDGWSSSSRPNDGVPQLLERPGRTGGAQSQWGAERAVLGGASLLGDGERSLALMDDVASSRPSPRWRCEFFTAHAFPDGTLDYALREKRDRPLSGLGQADAMTSGNVVITRKRLLFTARHG